ncbi:MAG: hypothetical protein ACRD0R_14365, partial [Acidimicrobiales bacterium]
PASSPEAQALFADAEAAVAAGADFLGLNFHPPSPRYIEPAAAAELARAVDGPVEPLLDGAELAVRLRRTRAEHLGALRDGLRAGVEMLYVPELFQRTHGVRATGQIAEALGAELGY